MSPRSPIPSNNLLGYFPYCAPIFLPLIVLTLWRTVCLPHYTIPYYPRSLADCLSPPHYTIPYYPRSLEAVCLPPLSYPLLSSLSGSCLSPPIILSLIILALWRTVCLPHYTIPYYPRSLADCLSPPIILSLIILALWKLSVSPHYTIPYYPRSLADCLSPPIILSLIILALWKLSVSPIIISLIILALWRTVCLSPLYYPLLSSLSGGLSVCPHYNIPYYPRSLADCLSLPIILSLIILALWRTVCLPPLYYPLLSSLSGGCLSPPPYYTIPYYPRSLADCLSAPIIISLIILALWRTVCLSPLYYPLLSSLSGGLSVSPHYTIPYYPRSLADCLSAPIIISLIILALWRTVCLPPLYYPLLSSLSGGLSVSPHYTIPYYPCSLADCLSLPIILSLIILALWRTVCLPHYTIPYYPRSLADCLSPPPIILSLIILALWRTVCLPQLYYPLLSSLSGGLSVSPHYTIPYYPRSLADCLSLPIILSLIILALWRTVCLRLSASGPPHAPTS